MTDFVLTKSEEKKAFAFLKKHKKCRNQEVAIGGGYAFIFTPTGIGCGIVVRCDICKKEKDITEYGNW